jgi:hypothetical protein
MPDDKALEPESGAFVLDDPNTDVISVVDDTLDLSPVSHRDSKKVGDNLPFPRPRDTGKKRQKLLLESEKLASLVSSYNFHFSEYCKGQRNVTQRVPRKVWKSVYADFYNKARELAAECGEMLDETNLPAERTFQDCLRCALEEQDTGTPDEKHAEKATLQCEDNLQRLKRSDGHATRNMMRLRQEMIAGKARNNADSSASRATVTANGEVTNSAEQPNEEVERRQTRLKMQMRTTDAIDRIASSISDTGQSTTELIRKQVQVLQEKTQAALERTREKSEMQKIEIRKKKLEEIAFLRDNKEISEEEFAERAKTIISETM